MKTPTNYPSSFSLRRTLCTLALAVIALLATAQSRQVTGTVEDTAGELLAAKPILGKVVDDKGNIILPGVEVNTARRLLKHEYTCELYLEGWRFFNLMRWHNNTADPDHATVLDGLVNKYKVQEYQTSLTGPVPFNYEKHHLLPIPGRELDVNPNMHGNSAN